MSLFQSIRRGLIPARLTVADLYELTAAGVIDPKERFELVDGEVVPMAAAKSSPHERMKSQLNRALVGSVPDHSRVWVEPTITLDPRTTAEPDLAVWPVQIESEQVRGPDLLLLIEVAVSSLPYDVRDKAMRYAAYGVRDYWVVDAIRRTIRVHRAPASGRYGGVDEYAASDAVTALLMPSVSICLDLLD